MEKSFQKMLSGYKAFRNKYASDDASVMQSLSLYGQQPEIMVVSCCDSRVDPALILQCEPGDLFVVRNVANIIPRYEKDQGPHGTSAALEFGVCFLKIKHLVILGHSQCAGIQTLLTDDNSNKNDFITDWVSLIKTEDFNKYSQDDCAKLAVQQSYKNCMTFPWIKEKVIKKELIIHLWFFDIKTGQMFTYSQEKSNYEVFY
jgi:carbonic anhydrase